MRCKDYVIWGVLLLSMPSAWAIYRCENAAGRLSFQDAPCPGNTKQATVDIQTPPPPRTPTTPVTGQAAPPHATPVAGSNQEAQRLNNEAERLRKFNRLQDLNNLHLASAGVAIERLQQQCRAEMQALSHQKSSHPSSLAQAMAAQATSAEMQAVATRCGVEQQAAQMEYDRLRNEKMQLERELSQ